MGFVGSRRSPLGRLVKVHTEPEPLRSTGVNRLRHYYGLLRLLPRAVPEEPLPATDEARWRGASADLSRSVLILVHALRPITPVDPLPRFGSLKEATLVLADSGAARHPRQCFRGLLRLHSRCGSCTRRPPKLQGPLSLGFRQRSHPRCRPGSYRGNTDNSSGRTLTGWSQNSFSRHNRYKVFR